MSNRKPDGNLKRGWTTGACATAATAAAYHALVTGRFPDPVTITLPKGDEPSFDLCQKTVNDDLALASIIKDAGDDPDVTHGAEIVVALRKGPAGSGVCFRAGDGVGTVTKAGLPIPPGESAINPGPRKMINAVISDLSRRLNGPADVEITISIPDGEKMAAKTMNGRLGIVGGLSVLGTTGIVIPYSCASWIHSIHRGIDVARANGIDHIAAATGSTSEQAVQQIYDLPESALIDMGDFAGGLLKYLRRHPVPRLTLAGGFAKLSKLAQGNLDLHSARSSLDMEKLAAWSGGDTEIADQIANANTAMEALGIAEQAGLSLAKRIAAGAREVALASLAGDTDVEVMVFDRTGKQVARAGG